MRMKKLSLPFLLATLTFCCFAQSADEVDIRKLESTGTVAFLKSDTMALKNLWDSNMWFVTLSTK